MLFGAHSYSVASSCWVVVGGGGGVFLHAWLAAGLIAGMRKVTESSFRPEYLYISLSGC